MKKKEIEGMLEELKECVKYIDNVLGSCCSDDITANSIRLSITQSLGYFAKFALEGKEKAYIAGYADKRKFEDRLEKDRMLEVDGRLGDRKALKLTVNKYLGYWHPGDEEYRRRVFEAYLKTRGATQPTVGLPEVEFEGIGEFTKTLHFIASSGVLKRKREDWKKIVTELREPS